MLSHLIAERSFEPVGKVQISQFNRLVSVGLMSVPPLTVDSIMESASVITGLKASFDDHYLGALHALVRSIHANPAIHDFGRFYLRRDLIQATTNRLLLDDCLRNHPEIEDVPIRRPVFIVGLPRTGSSLLHRILAQDPAFRYLAWWETDFPVPAQGEPTTRQKLSQQLIDSYYELTPSTRAMHMVEAGQPVFCNQLFLHSLASMNLEHYGLAEYAAWLQKANLREAYRYYRKQLQVLLWQRPGGRLLLKNPFHMWNLEHLLAVFPDACIIHTHREPASSLGSFCSLGKSYRLSTHEELDTTSLGQHWLTRFAQGLEHGVDFRSEHPEINVCDVSYKRLLACPLEEIQQIYRTFDLQMSPELENMARQYPIQNPQHAHGVHRYSLAEYGLDKEMILKSFPKYRQRFRQYLS